MRSKKRKHRCVLCSIRRRKAPLRRNKERKTLKEEIGEWRKTKKEKRERRTWRKKEKKWRNKERKRKRKNVGKERRSFLTGSLKIKKKERRGSVDPT